MVYFNEAPAHPTSTEETTQWGKVLEFKDRFQNPVFAGPMMVRASLKRFSASTYNDFS